MFLRVGVCNDAGPFGRIRRIRRKFNGNAVCRNVRDKAKSDSRVAAIRSLVGQFDAPVRYQRNGEREGGALAHLARDPYAATMQLDKLT
jgi:hypothetical protein